MSQTDRNLLLNLQNTFSLSKDLHPTSNTKRFQRTRGFSLQGSSKLGNYANTENFQTTYRQGGKTKIFKGIQKNDLSLITGEKRTNLLPTIIQKNNSLKQENPKQALQDTTHTNLISLRKKYDHFKHQVVVAQKEFDTLSIEAENLKRRQQQLEAKIYNQKLSDNCQNDAQQAKQLFEGSYWQYKSYQHMRSRLKKDMISYELRQNQLEEQNKIAETVLKNLEEETIKTQQFNHQTNVIMQNMMKDIEEQQILRQKELQIAQEDHEYTLFSGRFKQEQVMKQKEISEHTMHDKDQQEKKWRQLYLVHIFVNQMLKAKMERELQKFEVVEKAYQNIKQTTGIQDAQQIVEKFLTREKVYGELLASISEQEKQIENLSTAKDQAQKKLESLQQENLDMDLDLKQKQPEKEKSDLHKQLEDVSEEVKLVDLYKEKLYYWCISTLIQIQKINNKNEQNEIQAEQQKLLENKSQISSDSVNQNPDENNNHTESQLLQSQNSLQSEKNVVQVIQQQQIPNFYEIYPREKFVELFQKTIQQLKELEKKLTPEDLEKIKKQQNFNTLFLQKNSQQQQDPNLDNEIENLKLKNKRVAMKKPKTNLSQLHQNSQQSDQQQNYNNKNFLKNSIKIQKQNSFSSTDSQDYQTQQDTQQNSQFNENEEANYVQYMRDTILKEQQLKIQMKQIEEEKIKKQMKAQQYDD